MVKQSKIFIHLWLVVTIYGQSIMQHAYLLSFWPMTMLADKENPQQTSANSMARLTDQQDGHTG